MCSTPSVARVTQVDREVAADRLERGMRVDHVGATDVDAGLVRNGAGLDHASFSEPAERKRLELVRLAESDGS